MKANELRIGNYVSCPDGLATIVEIDGRHNRVVVYEEEYNDRSGYLLSRISPVPLTEEWLVKFGFSLVHKNNKHYFITLSEPGQYAFHVYGIDENFGIAFSDNILGETRDYIPRTSIKYVHELQTLYFALTGEELTIKQD